MWVHVETDLGDCFTFPHTVVVDDLITLARIMRQDYPDAKVIRMDLRAR